MADVAVVPADPPNPIDNPFDAHYLGHLRYVESDYKLAALADRLKQSRYRGTICGPRGCGKSALLKALGDRLMEHGLTPLPLYADNGERGALPADWMRTVRRARPTDVLLLDGYGRLPIWARTWVLIASRRAGGVIVTSPRSGILPTIARPTTSPLLLRQLIDQLAPTANGSIDHERLYREADGNLREAFRLAYERYAQTHG